MKTVPICILLAGGLWAASLPAGHGQTVTAGIAGPEAAGNCAPPPPGLIAWWRGESNALDSVGPYNGTLFNGVSFAPAEVGTGFVFQDGTQYVGLPQNLFPMPTSGSGSTPFSFELWFKTSTGGVLLGQQDQVPFGTALVGSVPALYVGTDGKLYAELFWNGFKQLVSSVTVNNGVFHHVAITYDGATEVLYLDGAAVASTSFTQQAYAGTYQYQLGTGYVTSGWPNTQQGWYPFNGIIDEASLYNRALNPTEVAAIFNAGSAGKCAGTPPQIVTQPGDQFVSLGANATFTVVATGTAPLSYQWQFNGLNLAESTHYVGAHSNVLTVVGVLPYDAGSYRVVITNAFGATNSAPVSLAAFPGCLPAPAGLVGWWRGENNALDSAGPNNGTLFNGVSFDMGEVGVGFSLNDGTQYIGLPQNLFPMPTSGTGNTPFSFELWFETLTGGIILGQQDQVPFGTALSGYVPALYVGTDGKLYASLFWDNLKQLVSGTVVNNGVFHHAAITYDGTTEVLYLDGVSIARTNFTQSAYSSSYQYQLGTGYATPGWPATLDGWYPFRGIIDEASLYNRALSATEVAAIFNAGSAGKCLSGPPQILTQPVSQAVPLGSNATFTVVATGTPTLGYRWQKNGAYLLNGGNISGATTPNLTVASVSLADVANYTVVVTNSAGSVTSSVATLAIAGPVLVHRYSFNDWAGCRTVFDLADGANGRLLFASPTAPYTNGPSDGSAFTGTGQLKLNGTNGYVDLPDGIISSLPNVTFEAWITWQDPNTRPWERLFDFGANDRGPDASGTGTNYLMLSPRLGGYDVVGFEESTVNPLGPVLDPKALVLGGAAPLPLNQPTYVALTYDPLAGMSQLFVNGQLVNSFSGALNPLSRFADYNNYLGRSQWVDDPFFKGLYDEFRIWQGILSYQQITNHFAAGPDQALPGMRPCLTVVCAGANVLLSWPTNGTASFKLMCAGTMPATNWTAVTSPVVVKGTNYQATVPATGTAMFYRLKQ